MYRVFRLCALGLFAMTLLSALGCQPVHKAYRNTKEFYHSYINRPATLDTEDRTVLESPEQRLVHRVMTIDEELSKLEKALDALATPPDAQTASDLMRRFPWLSGLALVAPDGTLGVSIPPVPLKQVDYSPLLEIAPKTLPRDLRASIQETPLGPEILLARPFLQEDTLQVLLVASFDFRALLPFASSPSDMIVRSPDILIWSGDIDYASTPLASIDWPEYLRNHTDGSISKNEQTMLWVTRYIGQIPLVFATYVR